MKSVGSVIFANEYLSLSCVMNCIKGEILRLVGRSCLVWWQKGGEMAFVAPLNATLSQKLYFC